jgi:hypothetical protein
VFDKSGYDRITKSDSRAGMVWGSDMSRGLWTSPMLLGWVGVLVQEPACLWGMGSMVNGWHHVRASVACGSAYRKGRMSRGTSHWQLNGGAALNSADGGTRAPNGGGSCHIPTFYNGLKYKDGMLILRIFQGMGQNWSTKQIQIH